MAATAVARTQLSHVPLTDPAGTAMDATNGNVIPNSGGTIWRFKNTDTSSHTVTFIPVSVVEDFTVTHAAYTVPASTTVWLGKHDVANFGANLNLTTTSALISVTAFEP
jgi:hypothetical protein